MNVLLNGLHKLSVFLSGIGVVHPQVTNAAKLLRRTKVDDQRLAVPNVQIAVGLRREAGMNLHPSAPSAGSNVLRNKLMDKILAGSRALCSGGAIDPFFSHDDPSSSPL